MANKDEDGGLFSIELSTGDEGPEEEEKIPRDFQPEEDFQRQRAEWKPKIEVGAIWKTLKLPKDHPSKPECQRIIHSIEELYLSEEYNRARSIADAALGGALAEGFRKTVVRYRLRCNTMVESIGEPEQES